MSRVIQSNAILAYQAPTPLDTADTTTLRGIAVLDATALLLNDILEMLILPADCNVVDVIVVTDDLDTGGPTITFDSGLLAGAVGDTTVANRTIGLEFLSADTTPGTGGVVRCNKVLGSRIPPAPIDRSLGIKVHAAATTPVVGGVAGLTNKGRWAPNTIYATNDYITLENGAIMYVTAGGGGASGLYADPQNNRAVSQYGPAWQLGKGLTTTDGALTWTCNSPIVEMIALIKGARKFN